jgi:hypothetical protein
LEDLKASANKSQIIWFLLYKDKAQLVSEDSDDLNRQSNAPDNSNLAAASMDYYSFITTKRTINKFDIKSVIVVIRILITPTAIIIIEIITHAKLYYALYIHGIIENNFD